MKFKGWQKVSLIDYPKKISTVLFTGGCNFRCKYCHNPELVIGWDKLPDIDEEEIINYLEKRKNLIDAVCITGGEPTLHPEIIGFLERVKKLGYYTKIDTNGTNPNLIAKILELNIIDYISMDIKTTEEKYEKLTGTAVEFYKIKSTAKIIMESNIEYEFRITVLPEFLTKEDAKEIKEMFNSTKFVLQQLRKTKTLDGEIKYVNLYSQEELKELAKILNNATIRL